MCIKIDAKCDVIFLFGSNKAGHHIPFGYLWFFCTDFMCLNDGKSIISWARTMQWKYFFLLLERNKPKKEEKCSIKSIHALSIGCILREWKHKSKQQTNKLRFYIPQQQPIYWYIYTKRTVSKAKTYLTACSIWNWNILFPKRNNTVRPTDQKRKVLLHVVLSARPFDGVCEKFFKFPFHTVAIKKLMDILNVQWVNMTH